MCVCLRSRLCASESTDQGGTGKGKRKKLKNKTRYKRRGGGSRRDERGRKRREERKERVDKGRDGRKKKASAHGPAALTSCHRTKQLFSARTLEEKKKNTCLKMFLVERRFRQSSPSALIRS